MSRKGFSIIELVVALAVLMVVLGLVVGYFARNAQLTSRTQAGNEVQDRVRAVMQLVTQDLQLAGSSRFVSSTGAVSTILNACTVEDCLVASDGGMHDTFKVAYATSLRPIGTACRQVIYSFSGDTLERKDVGDGDCSTDPTTVAAVPVADNILALDIRYRCSNGNLLNNYPDPANCPAGSAYPRSAVVSVVGRSTNQVRNITPITYPTVSGSVVCPAGYVCYAMTQEVLMPNLKDQ